jgi:hypothetical protein
VFLLIFYTKVKNKKYYFNIFLIKKHFQKLPYITLLITYSNNDAPSITVMFGVDTASISALNSNIFFKKNFIFFLLIYNPKNIKYIFIIYFYFIFGITKTKNNITTLLTLFYKFSTKKREDK